MRYGTAWLLVCLLTGAAEGAERAGRPSSWQELMQVWILLGWIAVILLSNLAQVCLAVLAVSLRPALFRKAAYVVERAPLRCTLLGLAAAVLLLVLTAVLGEARALHWPPLVIAYLILLLLVLWSGLVVSSLFLGQWVLFSFNSPRGGSPAAAVLTGGLALALCGPLPILGWLALLWALSAGLGGLLAAPFFTPEPAPEKAPPTPESPPS